MKNKFIRKLSNKPTKQRIKIRSAKAKGRNLQKWTCNQIAKAINVKTGKDLDIDSRPLGQSGCDIILRGKAKNCFPFSIECKFQEKWSIHNWIKQAKSNQKPNTSWLLVIKKSKQNPVVIIDAIEFFELFSKLKIKKRI
jgi:hypothetical protein